MRSVKDIAYTLLLKKKKFRLLFAMASLEAPKLHGRMTGGLSQKVKVVNNQYSAIKNNRQ